MPSHAMSLSRDITSLDNEKLTHAATEEKIGQVVYQIRPPEAPCPNDIHGIFYKKKWNIINKKVCGMIQDFLKHGHLLHALLELILHYFPKKIIRKS